MNHRSLSTMLAALVIPLCALAQAPSPPTGFNPEAVLWSYINKPSVSGQIAQGRAQLAQSEAGRAAIAKFNGIVADRFTGGVSEENQKRLWLAVFHQSVVQKQAQIGRPLTQEEKAEAANEYLQMTQRSVHLAGQGHVPEPMRGGSSEAIAAAAIVGLIVGAALSHGIVFVDYPYYHCNKSHNHPGDAFGRGADHGFYDGRNNFPYDPWHFPRSGWFHPFEDECERRAYLDGYNAGYRKGQHVYWSYR